MAKIFIDPRHGKHDPGAVGKQSNVKDNVLKVGNQLKVLLESAGHAVKMSSSTEVFIELSERARMANNWGADYFISLHNNSAIATSATGFKSSNSMVQLVLQHLNCSLPSTRRLQAKSASVNVDKNAVT